MNFNKNFKETHCFSLTSSNTNGTSFWLNDMEKIHWLIYPVYISFLCQVEDSIPHEKREEDKAYDKTGE